MKPTLILGLLVTALGLCPAAAQPTFTKTFEVDTIGPGSVSTLRFDIGNPGGTPAGEIAFVDNLPAGLSIASPTAETDCPGATLSAPESGTTITLSDGQLAPGASCTVTVDVVSSAMPTSGLPVTHMNVSGMLTSTVGSAGPATDDLTVTADLPGFTKSFSPSMVAPGQTSTLTLTVDNSANPSGVSTLRITDILPPGMIVASPAAASTDCGNPLLPPTVTAVSGATEASLFANGIVPSFPAVEAGATCTFSFNVFVGTPGVYVNTARDLEVGATAIGKAAATLDVPLDFLSKSFVDDPVPPGGDVTLEFMITNFDRNFSATDIAFTDDLAATLSGLTFESELYNDCGPPTLGQGTTLVSFGGGSLPPESTCTIRLGLSVPAGAVAGSYPNTTSAITADVGGPVVGNMATDVLLVSPIPTVTKDFDGDPVNPGDSVVLDFTVTNTSSTASATDISFTDVFSTVLPTASATPPAECCGPGSSCTFVPLFNPSPPCNPCDGIPARLTVTGGNLAPAGMAGDSCAFSVTLDVAATAEPGVYPNTTSEVTATVDGEPVVAVGASDDLVIVAAPSLRKAFTDDPVAPGGAATLEFTLELSQNSPTAATGITFTDDLDAVLSGLTANLPPSPDPPCGPGSMLTGSASDTFLTFAGGSLQPGEICTFSVVVDVPAGASSGTFTNTTSAVSATVSGTPATSAPASAPLTVADFEVRKEFLGDPALPGDDVTLRFTIEKADVADDLTGIFFIDSLASALSGMTAVAPLPMDPCGPGSSITGTSSLIFVGGDLPPGVASCFFDVTVRIPGGASDGTYVNTTSSPTASVNGSGPLPVDPAIDDLDVDTVRLSLIKSFLNDPVSPGGSVMLEFTLANLDATRSVASVAFTDDLSAALPGLTFDGVLLDMCGGTVSGTGTTFVDVSGVSLAAGASCVLRISLTVPGSAAAGEYPNTTGPITGSMGTSTGSAIVSGGSASDDLTVLQLLDFSKSFDGPTTATGTATLTFTITNPGAQTATGIAFSDDLGDVVPGLVASNLPTTPCGPGSSLTGTSLLLLTGGELAPMGGTCSFGVTVTVPGSASAGTFPNATSPLLQNGLQVAEPATADLVIEPPPAFGKEFQPAVTGPGVPSTLVFTIDNTASSLAASDLDFTDTLPAGLVVATPPDASTTCTDGTLTASAGSDTIAYTGGTVAATSTCTVQVDVVAATTGSFSNTTGPLTSSSGTSGTAHAVLAVDPPPGFHKSFSPNKIAGGGVSTLTFTIDNSFGTVDATGLDFTDDLPAPVVVATPANASTDCTGGTLTAADGAGAVSYTGGSVGTGSTCTVQVDVTSSTIGTHVNTSGALTSSLGTSGTANATLTVEPPPLFAKVFAPNPSFVGGVVTLTFTIDNSAATSTATDLDFTDVLPAALQVAAPANVISDCSGGSVTAVPGTATIGSTGGSVAAGAVCTISVDVISTAPGDHANLSGALTSSLGSSGTASDTLRVNPAPAFSKAFAPSTIGPGGLSRLTFSIGNAGSTVAATALDFVDNMPATVVVATPAQATTDCTGGILTATEGTGVVAYTGGSVAAGATCTIGVDVTTATLGAHVNTSGELTSSLGSSGTAEATLTVDPPPLFSKDFAPNPSIVGGLVTLTLTIDASAATSTVASLDFTDVLPAALLVADPANVTNDCTGGTVTAVPDSGTIAYTDGSVEAGAVCTLAVDVVSTASGDHLNVTGELTSDLGSSGTAEDTLRVDPPPAFTKAFEPSTIFPEEISTLTFTIDNSSSTVDATDLDFTDDLPTAITLATPAAATTDCTGGTLTALDGAGVASYSGGSVPAGGTCTVEVDVTSSTAGQHLNVSGALTSSLGDSGTAEATLTVEDEEPPVVTDVTTSVGTLGACDAVRSPIATLLVTVEDDRTPVLGADDSASYLLVGAGPDGDFSTTSCVGGAAGDDVDVPVQSVSETGSDPLIAEARVRVADEAGLAPGLYRLFVCDSITDSAGNALDGDGDSVPGGDFSIPVFRADPFNRLVNGHFDDCPVSLDPWTSVATPPNTIEPGSVGTDDFEASPLSASLRAIHSDPASSGISQCVPVEAGAVYDFEAWQRYEPVSSALAVLGIRFEFFDAPACTGASLGTSSTATVLEDEGGAWSLTALAVEAPVGAVSALPSLEFGPLGADPFFDLSLDGLFFGNSDLGEIFSDGFESGDTSAWTSAP